MKEAPQKDPRLSRLEVLADKFCGSWVPGFRHEQAVRVLSGILRREVARKLRDLLKRAREAAAMNRCMAQTARTAGRELVANCRQSDSETLDRFAEVIALFLKDSKSTTPRRDGGRGKP